MALPKVNFTVQDLPPSTQISRWAPTNAELPESLQALINILPFDRYRYDGLEICLTIPGYDYRMAVQVGDEFHYEVVRIRFAQKLDEFLRHQHQDPRNSCIPQKYWLQHIFIRPFIGRVEEFWRNNRFHTAASSQESTLSPTADEERISHSKETFLPFIRLPLELQELIWFYSIPTHQITRIKHRKRPGLYIQPTLPVTLLVCRQSRRVALRYLEFLPLTDEEGETRKVLCDPKTGILQRDHREYHVEHPDAVNPAGYSWCLFRGPHSHLNDQSHPWTSFCTISDLL